jgi:hypothetical protein
MSNLNLSDNAVNRLASQADAIGRLAQDSGGFSAVVAAFESRDANAYQWVLDRLEMQPYCELICEWVRIKLCALRCAEICVPLENTEIPSLQDFALAVVQLTSNESVLRRVVDSIACGDGSDYHAALDELQLGRFCQLICHWVCSVGYNRVCEVVCRPQTVTVSDPASDLKADGLALAGFVKNDQAFATISKAAIALDCETLQSTLNAAGFTSGCHIICRLICVWRSVWTCRTLCEVRPPILTGVQAIEEAQQFALAVRQLASQPRVLADLVSAVKNRDAQTYSTIIKRFGLVPYCWQVCGWVSSILCSEFCICVCVPPGQVIPLFTSVGCYLVGPPTSDFNANGTTVSGALAFTGTIPLIGLIPDGTAPDALKYRFTYQNYSGVSPNPNPVIPITGSMVPATIIGTLEFQYWTGTAWMPGSTPFYANNPGATVSIPQEFGSPLSVSVDTDTDADGWIQVPRLNDNSPGATGLFTPEGAQGLILLDTTKLTNEAFDLTGASILPELTAGETVPPNALSQKPVFQINFEAQTVATSSPVSSNSLNAIALSNTTYSCIRHPEWPGTTPPPVTTSPLVLSVDILELDSGGGCARLDDTIHVLYTAYHPYLGSCEVFLQGPDVSTMTTPPGGTISLPIQPNQGQVIGTGDGATTTFTGTLTTPVLPGSIRINAGAVTGNDNGVGAIAGTGISAGSINYATGAISVTFSSAPAVGIQILVDYNTNVSSGTAGTPFDMTGLPPCGYILWLQATLNLTSGLASCGQVFGTFSDYIPFCTITPAGSGD